MRDADGLTASQSGDGLSGLTKHPLCGACRRVRALRVALHEKERLA